MPWTKVGPDRYVSPSGRHWTKASIRAYLAKTHEHVSKAMPTVDEYDYDPDFDDLEGLEDIIDELHEHDEGEDDTELEDALEEAVKHGIAIGERRGRDAERREIAAMLRMATTLNGTTHAALAAIESPGDVVDKAVWQEDKHKRDHGKFSTTGGAKGGVQSGAGVARGGDSSDGGSTSGNDATAQQTAEPTEHPADAKAKTLAARIKEVPSAVVRRATEWVHLKYRKLADRYGETGAKAILGAMVLLAPTPIPGSSLLPVALAEAILRIRNAVKDAMQKAMGLTEEQITALAQDLWHELHEEMRDADEGKTEQKAVDPTEHGAVEDQHHAVMLAALEFAEESLRNGDDPSEGLERLADLAHDPEALKDTLAGKVEKAQWSEELHPRDDHGRWVSKTAIHAAKHDPEKAAELRKRVTDPVERAKLDKAIKGETDIGHTKQSAAREAARQTRETKRMSREEAKRLSLHIMTHPYDATHEMYAQLIPHLDKLTVAELRSVRQRLWAHWGMKNPRKAEMVAALVRHAKNEAVQDATIHEREALTEPVVHPEADTSRLDAAEAHAQRMREFEADRPGMRAAEEARDRAEARVGGERAALEGVPAAGKRGPDIASKEEYEAGMKKPEEAAPVPEAKPAKEKKSPAHDTRAIAGELAVALRQPTGSARQRAWAEVHAKHGAGVDAMASAAGVPGYMLGRGMPIGLFRKPADFADTLASLEKHAGREAAPPPEKKPRGQNLPAGAAAEVAALAANNDLTPARLPAAIKRDPMRFGTRLADAYRRLPPGPDREALGDYIRTHVPGVLPLHAVGEEVPFAGERHESDAPLSTGQSVRVTAPGWHIPGGTPGDPRPALLRRAQVEPVPMGGIPNREPAKEPPAATSARKSPVNLSDHAALADAVHDAARQVPSFTGGAYAPTSDADRHKAFIATVFDKMKDEGQLPEGTTLDHFKQAVTAAHMGGALELGRNDLPQTVPVNLKEDMQRSTTPHPSGIGEYHVVNTPAGAPAPQPAATPEAAKPKKPRAKKPSS